MFDDYAQTSDVCADCVSDVYVDYPDGKRRCKYCGHVDGTPLERQPKSEPVDTPVTGKTTRRRTS